MKKVLAIIMALWGGYVIYRPGELPIRVQENPAGGYTIYEPGELPRQVVPSPPGGATVFTPGELPTHITPDPPLTIHPDDWRTR